MKNLRLIVGAVLIVVVVLGVTFLSAREPDNPLGLSNTETASARYKVCSDLDEFYYEIVVAGIAVDYGVDYQVAAGFVNETIPMCGGF